MSKNHKTAYEIVRAADVARARSLAEQGLVAMAREILANYPGEELPQCVVEVGVDVPRVAAAGSPGAPRPARR